MSWTRSPGFKAADELVTTLVSFGGIVYLAWDNRRLRRRLAEMEAERQGPASRSGD